MEQTIRKIEDEQKKYNNQLMLLNLNIKRLENDIGIINKYNAYLKYNEYIDAQNNYKLMINYIDNCKIDSELKEINKLIRDYTYITRRNELNDLLSRYELYDKINKEIISEKQLLMNLQNKLNMLYSCKSNNENKLLELTKQYDLYQKYSNINLSINENINKINDYIIVYDIIKKTIGNYGLPHILIKRKLKILQDFINMYLNQVADFTIYFYIYDDNENNYDDVYNVIRKKYKHGKVDYDLNIYYISNNGDIANISVLSGYEYLVLNLLFKLAIAKFSCIPKCKLFVIDELLDSISKENISKFELILNLCKEVYDTVILLTHREDMINIANGVINVTKIQGVSKLIYS